MSSFGWIKLYRKIQECEFLWDSNDEPFDRRSAWIDLLLLANHDDKRTHFNGKGITIKAGQRLTSMRMLGERWHWGRERVRRYLDSLQEEGMIVRESDTHKTLITIVNYEVYQGGCVTNDATDSTTNTSTNEPQTSHKRATDEPQTSINKNNKEINKNDKNEKEVKKIYGEFKHVRLTEDERERLDIDFGVEQALDMIKILDEYIETSGKKYKNHNLVLRGWVLERVNDKKNKGTGQQNKISQAYDRFKAWAEGE